MREEDNQSISPQTSVHIDREAPTPPLPDEYAPPSPGAQGCQGEGLEQGHQGDVHGDGPTSSTPMPPASDPPSVREAIAGEISASHEKPNGEGVSHDPVQEHQVMLSCFRLEPKQA